MEGDFGVSISGYSTGGSKRTGTTQRLKKRRVSVMAVSWHSTNGARYPRQRLGKRRRPSGVGAKVQWLILNRKLMRVAETHERSVNKIG